MAAATDLRDEFHYPWKPRKYSPQKLWLKAVEYFKWCQDNPLIKKEQARDVKPYEDKEGNVVYPSRIMDIPISRPFSVEGFCIFANIHKQTFYEYLKGVTEVRDEDKRPNLSSYVDICTRIKDIIDNQHFDGGMAGFYNANIVSRKLGLVERSEQHSSIDIKIIVGSQAIADKINSLDQ